MKTIGLCFMSVFLLVSGCSDSVGVERKEERIISVGLQKQLFVDDYVVAKKQNVTRELGKVTKANRGKPIFTDGDFYGTVLYDEGKFKMWYRKYKNREYGYAESTDGLYFEKKALVTGIPFVENTLCVFIDPHETDKTHRYKAGHYATVASHVVCMAGLSHSADGIHWTPYNNGKPVSFRAADTYNQILWDENAKMYRLFTRTDFGHGGGPLADSVAKDFEVRGNRGMVNPDVKADPRNWKLVRHWIFDREGPEEYKRRQIYALTDWIYEGVHFALMSVYEWPGDESGGKTTDHYKRHERDIVNFYIATSRDADSWDLTWVYAGKPMVPRGPDGAFDKDMLFPSSTVVTHNDRHWLYYAGWNERHGTYKVRSAIGLATLRLDGFIYLEAKNELGTVVTKPFKWEGNTLQVNVDAKKGKILVEVLDAQGKSIPGFSGDDATWYTAVDELRLRPRWKSHKDVSALKGKIVRLKFKLKNAKLYSFKVNE